jgi:ABC-type spermidine/putrescine transport system permease subunit II
VWIILFCYLARFLVLGLRPVISGYYQLDRTLEEAAQIVGARLLRRLRTIIFPLVAPAASAGRVADFSHRLQRADRFGIVMVLGRRDAWRDLLFVSAGW